MSEPKSSLCHYLPTPETPVAACGSDTYALAATPGALRHLVNCPDCTTILCMTATPQRVKDTRMGVSTETEGVNWHWGPDPAFGNLCKHVGPREQCSGPDCEPEPDVAEALLS